MKILVTGSCDSIFLLIDIRVGISAIVTLITGAISSYQKVIIFKKRLIKVFHGLTVGQYRGCLLLS
jgi:hypothetical protein